MKFSIENATNIRLPAISEIGLHNWKETYKGILPQEFLDKQTTERFYL